MHDDTGYARFAHPKNIAVDRGRVMWAGATTDSSGKFHEEGWTLPGGSRTTDEATARAAAAALNQMAA